MPSSFTLTEQFAFGSQYSWRLKDSEIRFRGSGEYEQLVLQRIPASADQIAAFFSALDLLQVWNWRNDYDPAEVGFAVLDGSEWTFSASSGSHNCQSGGCNAYPSYADPKQTAIDRGRFALLRAAMYDCFGVDGYIYKAKRSGELQSQEQGEQSGEPELPSTVSH